MGRPPRYTATVTLFEEPDAGDYRAVLAALAGGDRVSDLLPDDIEIVDELALLGLVKSGQVTELGRAVALATS